MTGGDRIEDRLLTASEVSDLLAVPSGWILECARTGDLPCVRLGRYVRFRRSSVLEWIEERERESQSRRRHRPALREVRP